MSLQAKNIESVPHTAESEIKIESFVRKDRKDDLPEMLDRQQGNLLQAAHRRKTYLFSLQTPTFAFPSQRVHLQRNSPKLPDAAQEFLFPRLRH
jgi:hypothetical protein